MRKVMVIVLVLLMVCSVSAMANEKSDLSDFDPNFRMGIGYITIPNASGILLEGTFALSPETDFFFGMTPLEEEGFIVKAAGMDYKFNTREDSGFRPGVGIIIVANEGFSPTANINISDPEKDELSFTLRGGYNVFSGSVQVSF